MKVRSTFRKRCFVMAFVVMTSAFSLSGVQPNGTTSTTQALSASEFNADKIIDDVVFYNKDSMSARQIQDFLNQLIPNCDVWGTSKSEYGGGTRAQYAASRGWPGAPFVCLNKYYENPNTNETSYERGGGAFDGGVSAAQIIYDAAQQYGINPQVLLVLLKKESPGPLTADSWPIKNQYKFAMGYGCPDSGPGYSANCDSQKAGFYKQVNYAAWQLKYYKEHPNDYRYRIGSNQIQYSTEPSCGTKTVNIRNMATLSLYIYTPYTPNNGALANYPGTAPCGAYGNRNFYMFFREWFGSTDFSGVVDEKNAVWRLYNPSTGGHMFTSNSGEANNYIVNGWKSDGVVSHTTPSGNLSIHRLYNPSTKFHIVAGEQESSLLRSQGWIDDGEVIRGGTEGNPVWRISKAGHYFITSDPNEAAAYKQSGWNIDGILYFEPSDYEAPAWRLYNRVTGYHMLTSSPGELTDYIRAGWLSDGVIMSSSKTDTVPVYRLWNGRSHFVTANASEKDAYVAAGWRNDGVIFYTNNTIFAHRMYNSSTGAHRITASIRDLYSNLNAGWSDDGILFKVSRSSKQAVYEIRNTTSGSFFYTTNAQEVATYQASGWLSSGVVFYGSSNSTLPVYRLYNQGSNTHIIIQSSSERQAYINAGWINDGTVFNSYN